MEIHGDVTHNPYAIAGSSAAHPQFYSKLSPTLESAPDYPKMAKTKEESMKRTDRYVEKKAEMLMGQPLSGAMKKSIDNMIETTIKKEEDREQAEADMFTAQYDKMMGSVLQTGMEQGTDFESMMQISTLSKEDMEQARKEAMEEWKKMKAEKSEADMFAFSDEDLDSAMSSFGVNPFEGSKNPENFKYDDNDEVIMGDTVDQLQAVLGWEIKGKTRESLERLAGSVMLKQTGGLHINDFTHELSAPAEDTKAETPTGGSNLRTAKDAKTA